MDNLPSPQHEREQLEQQLLGEMQVTWDAYRAAWEEHRTIRREFGDMLTIQTVPTPCPPGDPKS